MESPFERGVWEAFLPLGAILAGSGFGELIKKYISVGKGPAGRADEPRARPRVQVTGPKVQLEVCQICMGKIKEGTEYVRCSSGKVFHAICLARVGDCPYCRRTQAVKGKEGTTTREFVVPRLEPAPLLPEVTSEEPANPCPGCGKELPEDATGCVCGVIFVTDGGNFPCPACGFQVQEGDAYCGRCGERFQRLSTPGCPVCGRQVAPGTGVCGCGAILGNVCPECGAELKDGDATCPACGTEFEFV